MSDDFDYDPDAEPIDNIARGLFAIASSLDGLIYALKYSKTNGVSVAEAIQILATQVSERSSPDLEPIESALTDIAATLREQAESNVAK